MKPLQQQIIEAIQEAERQGVTRYRLSQVSGVPSSTLSRIVKGKMETRLRLAERIMHALGKEITVIHTGIDPL